MIQLIIIICILALRYILSKIDKGIAYSVICYLGSSAPLVLLITDVLNKNAINAILAGFCMFYFALLGGRRK